MRSSRRAAGLKESDYDHEIDLVDHDGPPARLRPVSTGSGGRSSGEQEVPRASSVGGPGKGKAVQTVGGSASSKKSTDEHPDQGQEPGAGGPSIEIQEAPPSETPVPSASHSPSRASTVGRESAIDILYENERGGWLCGIPLFSSKALGNLDPSPWTNAFHKVSPSDIRNAQVPDPTWEWAWPEWRVHFHDDVDEGGWEYSFMFARKFSWHGPRWWNSFVRRRAWIRKRARKKAAGALSLASTNTDFNMLNAEYFSVRPASERSRSRSPATENGAARRRLSGTSRMSGDSDAGFDAWTQQIDDAESLLSVLRRARIDREKLEAVGVYLERGTDLENLPRTVHDIMVLFVFQASRTLLLANLTTTLDETIEALRKEAGGSEELEKRKAHLEVAIKCAEEEVRRLAYWSDIKGMVEGGETAHGVERKGGWGEEWAGVDQSGPAGPSRKEDDDDDDSAAAGRGVHGVS